MDSNSVETSFGCAKRELYEEFNIQFSNKIWEYDMKISGPKQIHKPGLMLYFLYLPSDLTVWYHKHSDTIYLDNK